MKKSHICLIEHATKVALALANEYSCHDNTPADSREIITTLRMIKKANADMLKVLTYDPSKGPNIAELLS